MFNDERRADQYHIDLRSFTQNVQSVVDQFRIDLNRISKTDILPVSMTNKVLELTLHYKQNFSALLQELNSYLASIKLPPRA
jgi:hypothetical protein